LAGGGVSPEVCFDDLDIEVLEDGAWRPLHWTEAAPMIRCDMRLSPLQHEKG
jgi:hypothetical protein